MATANNRKSRDRTHRLKTAVVSRTSSLCPCLTQQNDTDEEDGVNNDADIVPVNRNQIEEPTDLLKVTNSSFYWGVMDRFEAEHLLENKSEGTFILRDSVQSAYLFSVSFRRYRRTLHARVEHLNHRFSFDSYDTSIFSAPTVTELIKHYEDSSKCLFFEPLLTRPLHRTFPFSLQTICRATICDNISYNDIQFLELPRKVKFFLREYYYMQRVRVRQFE